PLSAIVFDYYFTFIPYFINMFSPLFTFIAVVFFTSKLAYNTEIVAILSSGIHFRRLVVPYMIGAIFIGSMSYVLANFIIPDTNKIMVEFEDKYINGPRRSGDKNVHMQISPGTHIGVESFNVGKQRGHKFSLEKFENGTLIYKIEADKIQWDTAAKLWQIKKYTSRRIHEMSETIVKGDVMDTILELQPEDFTRKVEDLKTMNYWELNEFLERERIRGTKKLRQYEVERFTRLSFPFSSLILTLIGLAVSSRKVRGGTGLHLGIGLTLAFTYILFMKVAAVFGTNGNANPLVAVWVPNVVFGFLAVYLLKKAPK
ncbi:MAG: LptF/LptG family permease, partial [Bacteroidales bacterium]|nr:LptF/LptG family permease [Bacteroidales bacterium]